MSSTRFRLRVSGASLVAGLAVAGAVATIPRIGAPPAGREQHVAGLRERLAVRGDVPPALSRRLERLRQALPDNGGESEDGPGGAGEWKLAALAYPADSISLSKLQTAQAAAAKLKAKGFPRGKGRNGTWVTVGPSQALYPFTFLRGSFNYVPNAYIAGGRTTSIAVSPTCVPGDCRIWISPAGGGVWRTKNALDGQPSWEHLSGAFGINAMGTIYLDPNDPTGNTIWAGTGEANACGSGCVAGVGLYKSTDGGDTWDGPMGKAYFDARAVGTIAVKPGDPDTIYVGTTRAGRGHSSVCCSGLVTLVPGAPKWGLYKSTDGGASFTYIHNGAATTAGCTGDANEANNLTPCSPRGVRRVALDPSDPEIVYAGSYARGVWRSSDGGASWTQIKAPLINTPPPNAITTSRPELAVTTLPNGKTRMYVAEGASGTPTSRLFRSDDVASGVPVFADLTSSSPADPGYGTYNYCTGQCWYDNFVHTPPGHPDVVYTGGSYSYGEALGISNARGVVLSTDAGVSSTDMTMDATDFLHPNGLHPDQHAIVTNPNDPFQFFESNDGGVMRSTGEFADASAFCDPRGLAEPELSRCRQLLSRVPAKLESMNKGLSTLQFQSLSVSPHNVKILQGGTQDNGTWESDGNPVKWLNTMIGDGGQSGFDVANPSFRFHNFFDATTEVNFNKGETADWIWIADPIFGHARTQFYAPVISDPRVSGTLFAGTGRTAYRTKTHGLGSMTLEEAQQHCNTWFGDFTVTCGDWAELGPTRLTSAAWGDRELGAVAAVERTASDTSTAWAATTTGRVFISHNVDADPASAVTWTRLDSLATNDPNRFVSGIYVDPGNPNRAWISYSGFNASTPLTPGHVFEVVYNSGAVTFTALDANLGDVPITDIVRDDVRGDLYISSDFGVMLRMSGAAEWTLAAPGMPNVEVPGLTIVPSARKLYAATHGLSAWLLNLP
jgi:hypothetical protein